MLLRDLNELGQACIICIFSAISLDQFLWCRPSCTDALRISPGPQGLLSLSYLTHYRARGFARTHTHRHTCVYLLELYNRKGNHLELLQSFTVADMKKNGSQTFNKMPSGTKSSNGQTISFFISETMMFDNVKMLKSRRT